MKLDELIKEIQDLKEKERQLEYLKKDKKKMADKLLEYELKEYKNTSVEERKEKYFKETCRCCRFHCENSNGSLGFNSVYLILFSNNIGTTLSLIL